MELKRPIDITITGRQYFHATDLFFSHIAEEVEEFSLPSPEEHSVELSTRGELVVGEEGVCISYDESEITGLAGCCTRFTLSDGVVCLTREGGVKSHLVFEDRKRYQLFGSQGPFPVSVQCHSLSHELTDRGGVIDIDYSVEIAGSTVEHNAYRICVSV